MGRSRVDTDTARGALTAVPDDLVTGDDAVRPPQNAATGAARLAGTTSRSPRRRADPPLPVDASCNEVRLVGRLGVGVRETILPSGDPVVSFHLVVSRAVRGGRGHERRPREPTVDTLACAAWTSRCRRTVLAAGPGDVLEVEGALRRRFRRAAGGPPTSFYEIEVSRVRRRTAGG